MTFFLSISDADLFAQEPLTPGEQDARKARPSGNPSARPAIHFSTDLGSLRWNEH
jgi:hypothetical protein